jgi:hypothetical protein
MSCRECHADTGQGEDLCPPCFVAASEARDAGTPKPGDFGFIATNDVQRAMHKAARRNMQFGNGRY